MAVFDRRIVLGLIASLLVSNCAALGGRGKRPIIALLLPLTGNFAGLAGEMRQAAQDSIPRFNPAYELKIFDTHGTADGAREAAVQAVASGAFIILGPVFSREVASVVAVSGAVPVISFSNDSDLIGKGAFVFGITPAQSIATIFSYAHAQGVRRVSVVTFDRDWGQRSVADAHLIAPRARLSIQQVIVLGGDADLKGLPDRLGNTDAVLLPDGNNRLAIIADALRASGVQLLGTSQWSGLDLASISGLQGAWFAAPDTTGLTLSSLPALLAQDAVTIAAELVGDDFARASLLRPQGFPATSGRVRFTADGSVERDLAVLGVSVDGIRVLSKAPV